MKTIIIKSSANGPCEVLIDDEDYEIINNRGWYVFKDGNTLYVGKQILNPLTGKKATHTLHRFIMNLTFGDKSVVDHIDGNGLNNQKDNLRICTKAQNNLNIRMVSLHTLNSTSRYKGVCWDKRRRKWYARIQISGKRIGIGYFSDENMAALAYNAAAIKYHGEFACLNIINKEEEINYDCKD